MEALVALVGIMLAGCAVLAVFGSAFLMIKLVFRVVLLPFAILGAVLKLALIVSIVSAALVFVRPSPTLIRG